MEMKKNISLGYYRIVYVLFIVLAIYQILGRNDFIDAASSLGIALIFDPFDQSVSWKNRPLWQKAWLFIHLAITSALFGYGISLD